MGDKMDKTNKQTIECSVFDCRHCNPLDELCDLSSIKVASCGQGFKKESTLCDSYKKR